jgi:hypothetical protein
MFSFASRIILTYGVERCATLGAYLCIIRVLSATFATVNHNNSLNVVCLASVLRFAVARKLLMGLPVLEPIWVQNQPSEAFDYHKAWNAESSNSIRSAFPCFCCSSPRELVTVILNMLKGKKMTLGGIGLYLNEFKTYALDGTNFF